MLGFGRLLALLLRTENAIHSARLFCKELHEMDIGAEELPPLGCRFELQSDQRSKNKLKLIADELVLDLTFIFECMARLACLGVRKLLALRPNPCPHIIRVSIWRFFTLTYP